MGGACSSGLTSDGSLQSNLDLVSVGRESTRAMSGGRPTVAETL